LLHFSFPLPLIQAFWCLSFYHPQLALPPPIIILLVPSVFQLLLLLPITSRSLPASLAPAPALLVSLRSLLVSSLFLQLLVAVAKPTLVVHAHTLPFRALLAPRQAAAVLVRGQAVVDAVLPALTIFIELRHYYRLPFSSFSFSFFLRQVEFSFRFDFRNLVDQHEFLEFPFVAIIQVFVPFPILFLSNLGNFILEATNFVKVASKYLRFHPNRLNRFNFNHFIDG
tara:strand:- start:617 stop:1294 length:678 start_codon:yes stop_codon:yes gene_type:complete